MNAFSTLVEFFADVSTNSIPIDLANSCPCSNETALFEVRSDLFPTSNLLTFSLAYLKRKKIHNLNNELKNHEKSNCLLGNFMQPLFHIVERFQIGHIVNNDDSMSTTIVARGNCAKSLLSSSIPLIKFCCNGCDL